VQLIMLQINAFVATLFPDNQILFTSHACSLVLNANVCSMFTPLYIHWLVLLCLAVVFTETILWLIGLIYVCGARKEQKCTHCSQQLPLVQTSSHYVMEIIEL